MRSAIKTPLKDGSSTGSQRSRPGLICIESSNSPALNKHPPICSSNTSASRILEDLWAAEAAAPGAFRRRAPTGGRCHLADLTCDAILPAFPVHLLLLLLLLAALSCASFGRALRACDPTARL